MKKEKTVRTYQRRTKSGKMVTVREHKASYDAAEEARKAAAKKAGAGSELSKKKAVKEENPLGFSEADYKEWYHWDMEDDANNEAALRVEKALTKKMGKKAYNKYLEDMSNSYSARGHKKAHQALLDEHTASQKKQDAEISKTKKTMNEVIEESGGKRITSGGAVRLNGELIPHAHYKAYKRAKSEKKRQEILALLPPEKRKILEEHFKKNEDTPKSKKEESKSRRSSTVKDNKSKKSETSTPESPTIPKSESALKKAGWTYVRTNRGKVGGGSIGYWVSPDRETMISGKSSYRPGSGKSVSIEADKPKKVTKSVLALLDRNSRASTTSAKTEKAEPKTKKSNRGLPASEMRAERTTRSKPQRMSSQKFRQFKDDNEAWFASGGSRRNGMTERTYLSRVKKHFGSDTASWDEYKASYKKLKEHYARKGSRILT